MSNSLMIQYWVFNCIFICSFELTFTFFGHNIRLNPPTTSRIYIYGGSPNASTKGLSGSTQLVILDISHPFNLSNPPYDPLSGLQNNAPPVYFNSISPGGQGNQLLFVCGGLTTVQFSYNTTNNQWSNLSTQASPPDRNAASAVTRLYDGSIYLFGGQDRSGKDFNDVWSLSTLNMTWDTASNGAPPFPRHLHTANLLSNGQMVIIGGLEKQQTVPLLNTIYIFDTTTSVWSTVVSMMHFFFFSRFV